MENTFEDIGGEFLAHHGREGQKWGVQNGPPYPLEGSGEAKFERQAAREAKKEARDKKKAQKRRTKILKDPKKIVRYQDEFTTEEIADAYAKLTAVNNVKKLIPKKVEKLSKQQKEWAKDPNKLLKNIDSFSKEQLALATEFAKTYDAQKTRQVERAGLPKKWLDLGSNYLQSFATLGTNVINLRTNINKLFGGMTVDEEHKLWLKTTKIVDPETGKTASLKSVLGDNQNLSKEEVLKALGLEGKDLETLKNMKHSDISEDSYAATAMAGEDFLAHYGVLGMKWGVRKNPVKDNPIKQAINNMQKDKARKRTMQEHADTLKRLAATESPEEFAAKKNDQLNEQFIKGIIGCYADKVFNGYEPKNYAKIDAIFNAYTKSHHRAPKYPAYNSPEYNYDHLTPEESRQASGNGYGSGLKYSDADWEKYANKLAKQHNLQYK